MARVQTLLIGFVLACAFSLALNVQSLRFFVRGDLTIANLGDVVGSADEVYFFALIREARDGFLQMGNSSLLEHRNAPSLTGYALLPQALLARLTSLPLTTIIFLGDVIFSLFIAFLIFLISFCLFKKTPEATLFALAFLVQWNISFLRTMNPQVTMCVFFACLYLFFSDSDNRHPVRRGIALALSVLVQPILAILLLVVEALDACRVVIRGTSFVTMFRARWILFFIPLTAGILQYLWVLLHADPHILADLSARRGLIPTYIPSDPQTSVSLLMLGGLWCFSVFRIKKSSVLADRMVILALAGLIVLQQHVVHGHEAIFGLYYRLPLTFFLGLLVFLFLQQYCKRWLVLSALTATFLFYASTAIPAAQSQSREYAASAKSFVSSGMPEVLASLEAMKGERVVLAPIEVSNLVPVLTSHYTLFTQYAHYEYVSDAELAERYLLLQLFFPLPETMVVEGDPVVFGLYAGNLYAKKKSFCRMLRRLGFTERDCFAQSLSDFIYHQDARHFVEAGEIDVQASLKKYGVNTVISDQPLPQILTSQCKKSVTSGPYAIYDCDFR